MKELVEYIVSNLVNHPEDVIVTEEEVAGEENSSNITIQVNSEDVGRVIGRSGNVINSIRLIARIAAIQKGVRVRVDLKDDGQPQPKADEPMAQKPEVIEQPAPILEEEPKD